jgi:(E)-4-hydroxy-3-methylbut-2-enyl-diphosphate synthase
MKTYCEHRTHTLRRLTREVKIGTLTIGGRFPVAVQSMTTTPTEDVAATVAQARELFEAGCELVRITAPSLKAARALSEIRAALNRDGFHGPLAADIHFLPKAAMESVEHVEKVRINPGNFADYKQFKVLQYSDAAYQEELERIHDAFTPFVQRCKALGRAIRIGTNHGSLSDRILNRYGDTPEGMVESALEFIRIAESHGFRDVVLSMKASNPKVMIAAYRLAVARMREESMDYPLHLGVTEAGDGEDARIKSCMGIGALLADGLGDTIRVSLTEDPVHEIPVARDLVRWAERQASRPPVVSVPWVEHLDPFHPARREIEAVQVFGRAVFDRSQAPMVAIANPDSKLSVAALLAQLTPEQMRQRDASVEYWVEDLDREDAWERLSSWVECLPGVVRGMVLMLRDPSALEKFLPLMKPSSLHWIVCVPAAVALNGLPGTSGRELSWCFDFGGLTELDRVAVALSQRVKQPFLVTLSSAFEGHHALGSLRRLVAAFDACDRRPAVWLRNLPALFGHSGCLEFRDLLLESSIFSGGALAEGIGNLISIETEPLISRARSHAYNVLQAARARISKTEFVACPSCGRTLFDLQSTTRKIRERTDHLKGVTLAIMGCIVNGPGEMADADFGYVGGAPGKVNLYVGKKAVRHGIPESEAVDALIELIKEHGKWVDPQ